ncbi:type VI secretion system secreted protein VgrG [Oxalobacteraceae bacterium GrIS 1.11]
MNLQNLSNARTDLSDLFRPIRLRLLHETGVLDDVLLVQKVSGVEQICGGFEYRLLCVSTKANLPLKQFMAMAVELQFVTDRDKLRTVCGFIDSAVAGEADGNLATYELIIKDALSIMDKGRNTRIFRDKSVIDITHAILDEWRHTNSALAASFGYEELLLNRALERNQADRAFTFQYNESDAAFLRRLWKQHGLAWFFKPGIKPLPGAIDRGRNDTLAHSLVLFDYVMWLDPNAAGTVRYHRDDGTEKADSITAWHAARTLTPGNVMRKSWDYNQERMDSAHLTSNADQGVQGNAFASHLVDKLIDVPHAADNRADFEALGALQLKRHDFVSKCFQAESGVRLVRVGEYIFVTGHDEIDSHPQEERAFVITEMRVAAENNLPKALGERVNRLFALNHWGSAIDTAAIVALKKISTDRGGKYTNQFTCVRRGIPIVPAYDPRVDLPRVGPMTAVVVGPEGQVIHCDELGRVKVRFPGCRRETPEGRSAPKNRLAGDDSAWLQQVSYSAGPGYGAIHLPRIGSLVTVDFMGGDISKPFIHGSVYGGRTPPPRFSHVSSLPAQRHLSGIVTREFGTGTYRANQLRFDDSNGELSAQLSSDHGATQLNLGYLTQPRSGGNHPDRRGEGFELRTDDSGTIRTAKSLLISAWKRLEACNSHFSSEEHHALMQDCLDLFKSLGQYAAEHQALALDSAPQAELKDDVHAAPGGSNVDPQGQGGKPTLSLTAPAGIAVTTPKTIVSYAGANFDAVAQHHMQLTSGQRFNLNAGKGISLFSHSDGIKAIAHNGKLVMQSQHDDTEINSAKNIRMTANDSKIVLMAKEIHMIAEDGSFIKIGGGVTLGTNGVIKNQATDFKFSGAATMHTELPTFGGGDPDQKFVLKYGQHIDGPVIAPNREFEIDMSDGSTLKGISDAMGKTNILQRDAMHIANVRILTGKK